jgi:hypothetical protein
LNGCPEDAPVLDAPPLLDELVPHAASTADVAASEPSTPNRLIFKFTPPRQKCQPHKISPAARSLSTHGQR